MNRDEISPTWELNRKLDPICGEIIELIIILQGLEDGSSIQFSLDNDTCNLAIPGKLSTVQIPLECTVNPKPLLLRYNQTNQYLKAFLSVTGGTPFNSSVPAHAAPTYKDVASGAAPSQSSMLSDKGEDIEDIYARPTVDPPSPPQQQTKKKKKNKKGSRGGGGAETNNIKTQPSGAAAPSSSCSQQQHQKQVKIKSHKDALRQHLGPKTYNKLIETYTLATEVMASFSIIFFFSTLATLPSNSPAASLCPKWIPSFLCLPSIVYSLFLHWWWSRMWLGATIWNTLAAIFANWTLENMILPLVFAACIPSQPSAYLQEVTKTTTNNNLGDNNQENDDSITNDDPTDAFVQSAPRDNGSKYSYSSLLKLLQWHKYHTYPESKEDESFSIVVYSHLLLVSQIFRQLWLLSFVTGDGRLWLGAAVISLGLKYLVIKKKKKISPRLTNTVQFRFILDKIDDTWFLLKVGTARVAAQLLWRLAKSTYVQYTCWSTGGVDTTGATCSTTIDQGSSSFYKGSDVELIFRIFFYKYSLFQVLVFTPSLLFLSYLLSKVNSRHLPRWWWVICPKKDVVLACLKLAHVCVMLAWLPATNWVTNYTIEFVLLYGWMVYDTSILNIPYEKTAHDAYPSLNPVFLLLTFFIAKNVWCYLVWRPWLPVTFLVLVISTSSALRHKIPFLTPDIWQTILYGGLPGSIRVAKLMPLTVYLLGGRWNSTVAVLLPHAAQFFVFVLRLIRNRFGLSKTFTLDEEQEHRHQDIILHKKLLFTTSMSIFFWAVVQPLLGKGESTTSKMMMTVFLGSWFLLAFTPLCSYLESFVNGITMPNIDAIFFELCGAFCLGGGGGAGNQQQKQHSAANGASPASSSSTSSDTIPPMMESLPVPEGATPMVRSILRATNHYSVLGMPSSTATDEEIRKAKRMLSLATHPDKAGQAPGAVDACQRVLQAADVLLDRQKRKQYDEEVALARFHVTGAAAELEDEVADMIFQQTGVDITQTDYIMVACDCCALAAHQAPVVPNRTADAARYCNQHKTRHPVAEKESWIEKEFAWDGWLPGSVLRYYMCHQGKVYDCSAAAECAGLLQVWAKSGIEANTHENYYNKLGPGGKGGKSGRSAAAPSSSSSASAGGPSGATKSKKKGKKGRR